MTSRREMVVVILVSILAMVPIFVGLATFNAVSPSVSIPPPGCSVPSANSTIPSNSSSEVLLPAGDVVPIAHEGSIIIEFSIEAPGDLRGAWESPTPVGLTVLSNLSGMYLEPPISSYSLVGEINASPNSAPLYPATWAVTVWPLGWWNASEPTPGPVNFTVTQTIEVVFDRTLTILQRPAELNVSAGSYVCWQMPPPAVAQDAWLVIPPLPATNEHWTLAVLPPPVFRQFQTNRSVISSPDVWELWQGVNGYSSGDWSVPVHLISADILVFYNWALSGTTLTVYYPMELSYVVGS